VSAAYPIFSHGRLAGVVALSKSPRDTRAALWQERSRLIWASLAVAGLLTALSLAASFRIIRPLKSLALRARRVADGTTPEFRERRPGLTEPWELALLEESVGLMAGRLVRRSEYLKAFARGVSHEFKTPLASARGALELLFEDTGSMPPSVRERFSRNVLSDLSRLESLANRLMALARAEAAAPAPDARTDAAEVARDLCARLCDRAPDAASSGAEGAGMEDTYVGPRLERDGLGAGLEETNVGPGLERDGNGYGLEEDNVGPGLERDGNGYGLEEDNVGPGLERDGSGAGLENSTVGPSLKRDGSGAGLEDTDVGPGLEKYGLGYGLENSGAGLVLKEAGVGADLERAGVEAEAVSGNPTAGEPGAERNIAGSVTKSQSAKKNLKHTVAEGSGAEVAAEIFAEDVAKGADSEYSGRKGTGELARDALDPDRAKEGPSEVRRFAAWVASGPRELWLAVDRDALETVLKNLIANAREAGATSVSVRLSSRGARGTVEVSDNGPGVPPENRDRIFAPFFTTRKMKGGTGLGLALCRMLLAPFRGELGFAPPSSFRLTIPLWRSHAKGGKRRGTGT
jgi:signal transduction histidine kinase